MNPGSLAELPTGASRNRHSFIQHFRGLWGRDATSVHSIEGLRCNERAFLGIQYRYDEAQRLLHTVVSGEITDEELLSYAAEINGRGFPTPRLELFDCREATTRGLTPGGLRRVAATFGASEASEPVRAALVAPEDAAFGLSRMYQAYRMDSDVELSVFRDASEARAWLGVEPE